MTMTPLYYSQHSPYRPPTTLSRSSRSDWLSASSPARLFLRPPAMETTAGGEDNVASIPPRTAGAVAVLGMSIIVFVFAFVGLDEVVMGRQSGCRDHRGQFVNAKDLDSSLGCVAKTIVFVLLGRLSVHKVFIDFSSKTVYKTYPLRPFLTFSVLRGAFEMASSVSAAPSGTLPLPLPLCPVPALPLTRLPSSIQQTRLQIFEHDRSLLSHPMSSWYYAPIRDKSVSEVLMRSSSTCIMLSRLSFGDGVGGYRETAEVSMRLEESEEMKLEMLEVEILKTIQAKHLRPGTERHEGVD
ncbi:hypothetical protein BKA70DRAFT_1232262 [Coprinopsis sp. MPI-PUGE-AT-0042]|nr:hypothetical protein BKA70DRAFT_1232262 [Coprinopsis sp. MPI-PUGE-AT-0042]